MSGRCGIMGLGKGRARELDRETERQRILKSFEVLEIPADLQALVREALESTQWDWFRDCDGCTAVSEVYWPTIYFPPCLRHDFDWFTGHGGWESNARFYRLQRAYGMERVRGAVRWTGVTLAWYGAYKWWHRARGNVAGAAGPAAGPQERGQRADVSPVGTGQRPSREGGLA